MKLIDCNELMDMSDLQIEEYAEELQWLLSYGVTQEMAADIEFAQQMIEVELAQR